MSGIDESAEETAAGAKNLSSVGQGPDQAEKGSLGAGPTVV